MEENIRNATPDYLATAGKVQHSRLKVQPAVMREERSGKSVGNWWRQRHSAKNHCALFPSAYNGAASITLTAQNWKLFGNSHSKLARTRRFFKGNSGPISRPSGGNPTRGFSVLLLYRDYVTQRYPKRETNMFVVESTDQAAIFSVWNVASISR